MLDHILLYITRALRLLQNALKSAGQWLGRYWRKNRWHKAVLVLCIFLSLCLASMYGIARWYIASNAHKPLVIGTTFIPSYAQYLGVNPEQTMDAILGDLHVKHVRLVSYWDEMEPTPGTYDFSQLDWQFKKAEAHHAAISLSIGLRQPRWPECHMPDWAQNEPISQWQPQLEQFMTAVISRYKDSPSLESYQLENEFFLANFGHCTDFSRSRLISEFNVVKKADPTHPVIMSRSDNMPNIPLGNPRADIIGMSVYRKVWDGTITHRYFTYPLPAWYYAFLAGAEKLATGRDSVIHEMQAEAWPPDGDGITKTTLAEQNNTLDAPMLADRASFGAATGMRQIDLWGSEYWYYRLIILHDNSVWNTAKQIYK